MKSARNRVFGNKEHKAIDTVPEQKEIVAGHYRESSLAWMGQ